MNLVDKLQSHSLAAGAAIGLVLGSVAGVAWPVSVPPPPEHASAGWSLPPELSSLRPPEKEFSIVRDAPAWGGANDNETGAKESGWRLVGIIARPEAVGLVAVEGGRNTRVRVGETLPDGARLAGITAAGIIFEKDGCRQERLLYAAESEQSQACASAKK
ncbi:hypothetical protein GCM10008101_26570 [Lysobacter xinjiangensis]|uniref:Uncharacterized protein n=1 Tax=Cognatilysobacter xinjiangensis TaxID=546892 RepID=A0ABQ3CAE5_9GAMM|nr:hypothetical protein [Lysobacter xinjiangensis]GGZ70893.1 hypothetical protein GCM10008101_26570 [Lysobacter xinjiangensis]